MQSFCTQSAHTPAYHVCWGIQLLVPPLSNFSMLKFLTFGTSFSVLHCLPVLSTSRARKAITKTIPCDWRKLIKLMLRKCMFLPPHSHLTGQFVKQHLVTIWRELHVLAQWLRQYFYQDHGVRSVEQVVLVGNWCSQTNCGVLRLDGITEQTRKMPQELHLLHLHSSIWTACPWFKAQILKYLNRLSLV